MEVEITILPLIVVVAVVVEQIEMVVLHNQILVLEQLVKVMMEEVEIMAKHQITEQAAVVEEQDLLEDLQLEVIAILQEMVAMD